MTSSSDTQGSRVHGASRYGGRRYLPYVFTEHGALMAANVLRSNRAVQMSVFVVRAFVKMRELILAQQDLAQKLASLENRLTARMDIQDEVIVKIIRQLRKALNPPQEPPEPKKEIGFRIRERKTHYSVPKRSPRRKKKGK